MSASLRLPLVALLAAAATLLPAGCASPGYPTRDLVAGDSRERVATLMGPPAATYPMPGGATRLEYSHPPAGRQTFMVDLDAAGRVVRWEQVLDEIHFAHLRAGMAPGDVLREIGTPSDRSHYTRPQPADTWIYHYETRDHCLIFQVAFGASSGVTLDGGDYLVDPRCGMSG